MRTRKSMIWLVLAFTFATLIEALAPASALVAEGEGEGPICRKHNGGMCNVPAVDGCDPCETS